MKFNAPVITAITLLACSLSSSLLAQDAGNKIDEKAKGIMDRTINFLTELDSLQVDTVFHISMSSDNPAFGGQDINESLTQQMNVQSSDQFSLISQGDASQMGGANAYYNKGTGAVVIDAEGAIEVKDLKDLSAFFESEALGYQKDMQMNPLLDQNVAVATLKAMLVQKEGESWEDSVSGMEYIAEEEVDGAKAHHLKIVGEDKNMGFDLWVSAGDQPLLLKVLPDMKSILEAMGGADNPMMADLKMEVSGQYKNWKINEKIDEKKFIANLADIEKFDNFEALITKVMGGPGGPGPSSPADELLGQPAGDFELTLLNGDSFKLSDQKGKNVVILDFWATWCGPCVRALPELMAAAEDFKDKNVILVAVNQREDKGRIQKFLDKQRWKLTVALDKEGEVGDLFNVQGIPQTVIVGKDGTVKKVHVGFAPGLQDQIAAELEEILAE